MSRAFVSPIRSGFMALVIVACFGTVLYRLFDLHVLDRSRLSTIAEQNRQKFEVLHARRGDVVDQRGNKLATSRYILELGVDPQLIVPGDYQKIPALAQILGLPAEKLTEAFSTKYRDVESDEGVVQRPIRWVPLHPGVEESVYDKVAALHIKGLYGNRKYQRVYPGGQLAAHVLGYLNSDEVPTSGVETAMDFYLRGQDGWIETEHDGKHRELEQFTAREVKPTDGLNVELTIDMMLQYYAERELDRLVAEYKPQGATIVMSNPVTGEILALANYPTYDPNHYGDAPMVNLKNRAVTDVFEPGSTFKVVTAAAALNEGVVRPEDRFDCAKTTIEYNGRTLKLPGDHETLGVLTVSQIVSHSSNRGAANIGVMLGEQRLYDYAYAFGFGQPTALGLGGESRGVLWPVSKWDGLMITRVPMGHAVSATAMQVHQAMTVVANRGLLMQPELVRRIYDSSGQTVVAFSPKPERRVISIRTAELLNEMLCAVVGPDGTAAKAKLQDITVAGKTGTTQKLVDGHYSTDHHVATFSGYLPAERPRLVITVVVDDARTNGTAYGGIVSAPAFHNVAALAVQYLGIQPVGGRPNLVAMKGDNLDWFR